MLKIRVHKHTRHKLPVPFKPNDKLRTHAAIRFQPRGDGRKQKHENVYQNDNKRRVEKTVAEPFSQYIHFGISILLITSESANVTWFRPFRFDA